MLPELSVTVPLIVAEKACDWANRRGLPQNMAKANITIIIVVTICDRVARLNCIGCASLKMICSWNGFALKTIEMSCPESDDHPR
jgi:hypothetical protein